MSVSRTLVGTAATLIGSSMISYGIIKDALPGSRIISKLVIIPMYFQAGLIPWYLTMKAIGMQNNFLVYILPTIIVPFYVILIKTYMQGLPPAMEESAMVDGAGYFTIYTRIVMPLSMPILATIAIFAGVNQWNSWTDNLYLCPAIELRTLQMLLYSFLSQRSAAQVINASKFGGNVQNLLTPMAIRMTITVIVTLPIFVIYPFLQKYFIKGIMIGAVKG